MMVGTAGAADTDPVGGGEVDAFFSAVVRRFRLGVSFAAGGSAEGSLDFLLAPAFLDVRCARGVSCSGSTDASRCLIRVERRGVG